MSVDAWVHRWWAGEAGIAGRAADLALAPAEAGFRAVAGARNGLYDRGMLGIGHVPVPVVSIGNVAVGGAGKTPVAAWVAARLRAWGRTPAIALRGYGEDEILLHRELNPGVPVFRGARRIDAARAAVAAGCDAVVLDDAFQHRALARDLDVVLVPVESWHARPRLLPRGPWRESPRALARADLVVLTRKTADVDAARRVEDEVRAMHPRLPVTLAALVPAGISPLRGGDVRGMDALAGRDVLAVAALATPRPFLAQLAAAGARVEAALHPDHHDFTAGEAAALARRAEGRTMVMTRKDAVKLRPLLPAGVDALVLEQRVEIERGADALDAALRRAVEEHGG